MCVFGTRNERVNNHIQKVNKNNMIEKWYDMGDLKLVETAKKPCPKEQETVQQNLLVKDKFVRTGRNLGIDREKEGSARLKNTESEKIAFSLGSSAEKSRIPRTPRNANSALDLFNSFFSNNVKLTITSTSLPSTTLKYSRIMTTSTTTASTTTTFSSSGNSNTILIISDSESDLVPKKVVMSDSEDIEIVDYTDDGTGDCCWFNK